MLSQKDTLKQHFSLICDCNGSEGHMECKKAVFEGKNNIIKNVSGFNFSDRPAKPSLQSLIRDVVGLRGLMCIITLYLAAHLQCSQSQSSACVALSHAYEACPQVCSWTVEHRRLIWKWTRSCWSPAGWGTCSYLITLQVVWIWSWHLRNSLHMSGNIMALSRTTS